MHGMIDHRPGGSGANAGQLLLDVADSTRLLTSAASAARCDALSDIFINVALSLYTLSSHTDACYD